MTLDTQASEKGTIVDIFIAMSHDNGTCSIYRPERRRGRKRRATSDVRESDLIKKRRCLVASINSWTPVRCCRRYCFEEVGVERCRALRELFLTVSRDERKAELIELLDERDEEGNATGFVIYGWRVCWQMLINTLGVSKSLICNVLGLPSAIASPFPGRLGGSDISLTKKTAVIAFFRTLADEVADEIPNKDERHLPHGNKRVVFALYKDNESRYGREPCSASHFYSTWKLFASHIKCRRNHGFTVCDTCTLFKERLMSLARILGCEKQRQNRKKNFANHLNHVISERAEYRRVQMEATDRPNDVLSVIIDGADQAKFGLPRFHTQTKMETGQSLKQKVTGVCFHGVLQRKDFVCFFTSAHNVPSGANQTADALCRSLLLL